MRYADLIQFEPIESVIQLLDANRPDEAKKLVSTYVISDDMAERIAKQMIPQLSFDAAVDHMGAGFHQVGDRAAVAGPFHHIVGDQCDGFGMVQLDAAFETLARHDGGHRDQELVFFAGREVHAKS